MDEVHKHNSFSNIPLYFSYFQGTYVKGPACPR